MLWIDFSLQSSFDPFTRIIGEQFRRGFRTVFRGVRELRDGENQVAGHSAGTICNKSDGTVNPFGQNEITGGQVARIALAKPPGNPWIKRPSPISLSEENSWFYQVWSHGGRNPYMLLFLKPV